MIRISGRKLINILASGDETQEISSAFVSDYQLLNVTTSNNLTSKHPGMKDVRF